MTYDRYSSTHRFKALIGELEFEDTVTSVKTLTELATGASLHTTSDISMRFGPGGTSPPAGTKITSQSEYNALGYDLESLQDCYRILPLVVDHEITMDAIAGRHPANGDTYFGLSSQVIFPPLLSGPEGVIAVQGEATTVHDPSQAGNVPDHNHIQRSSGTWTVNEHRDRLALITSGIGAGKVCPIVSNTADTLRVSQNLATGGCTFEIYTPSAILEPGYWGIWTAENNNIFTTFKNLVLGDTTTPFTYINPTGSFSTLECTGRFNNDVLAAALSIGIAFWRNAFVFTSGASFKAESTFRRYIIGGCYIRTDGTSPIIIGEGGCNYDIYYSTFEATGALSDSILRLGGAALALFQNYSYLIGNGSCVGLKLLRGGSAYFVQGTGFGISNCSSAIDVDRVRVELPPFDSATSTGNTNGYVLSNGAQVVVDGLADIAATNGIIIDGTTVNYSDAPVGDYLVGSAGSSILRLS